MVRAKGLMSFKFLCSVCGASCGHKGEPIAWVNGKDILCNYHHEQERLERLRTEEWDEDEYPHEFP